MSRTEAWRPVVGYEGSYEVSNLGRVRSLDRVAWTKACKRRCGFFRTLKGRILELHPDGKAGYLRVSLGKGTHRSVHALVAEAFVSARPKGAQIRHLNCDLTDNRAVNLAYGNASDNAHDVARNDRRRISRAAVEDIRASYDGGRHTVRTLAERHGCSPFHVRRILSGEARPYG